MSQSSQTDNPERPEGRSEAEATQQEMQASPDRPDQASQTEASQTEASQTEASQTQEPDAPESTPAPDATEAADSSDSSDASDDAPGSDAAEVPAPTARDDLGEAMDRLEEADPGDTQEVLDAGTQVNDRLQERLDDLTSRGSEQRSE